MKQHKFPVTNLIAAVFLLIAAVAAVFLLKDIFQQNNSNAPSDDTYRVIEATEWGRKVTHDGVSYVQKEGLTTVLLLGIDAGGDGDPLVVGNGGRSDTIILLILGLGLLSDGLGDIE